MAPTKAMREAASIMPTMGGFLGRPILKPWSRHGLAVVAGLAAAVGCSSDGGTGPAADYTLSLTPAALTIVQGATRTASVTITRTNFTGAVTLSLGNAPAGVIGSFDPAAPTGTSSTLTLSVGTTVTPGVKSLTVDGTASGGNRSTPLTLTVNSSGGGGNVTTVVVGQVYSCALNASGQAYCWGGNGADALGAPSTETCVDQRLQFSSPCSTRPLAVSSGLTFAALSAFWDHTCAVTPSGMAYCWGPGSVGQLGDGTTTDRLVPTQVAGGFTFAAISAGYEYTCGVTTSGAAYCWGGPKGNGQIYGQLGDGTTEQRLVPTAVVGGLTFAVLRAGEFHTCGVTTSGVAYCWGHNVSGALGDGTTTDRLVPTPVAGGLTFAALSAGSETTCGVTMSGVTYCWGGNVGDGTTMGRLVPTLVAGGLRFAVVSAGELLTCGVTTSGAAYCWGGNRYGELGDGTTTDRLVPTPVAGGLTFAVVDAGTGRPFFGHTCGVTTTGAAYCWGWNGSGELGDGTTTQRLVPTAVAFP